MKASGTISILCFVVTDLTLPVIFKSTTLPASLNRLLR